MLLRGFLSCLMVGCFMPVALAQPMVSGQVYNPSCPGYYSVSLADLDIQYKADEIVSVADVNRVDIVYSIRNAWTQQSWYRLPIEFQALFEEESGFYRAKLIGLEVGARGSYTASHFEFALRIETKDGRILWDNGQKAPLGFYSVSLPALRCFPGAKDTLSIESLASGADYIQVSR